MQSFELSFWAQSDVPYSWDSECAEATTDEIISSVNNAVVALHWTHDLGLYAWWCTNCNPEELCDCDGNNCDVISFVLEYTLAAATTAKSVEFPLVVDMSMEPTWLDVDQDSRYW